MTEQKENYSTEEESKEKEPSRIEVITTYTIAAICIALAIGGYVYKDMDTVTVRWLMGFAVILSEGRDVYDFLIKK